MLPIRFGNNVRIVQASEGTLIGAVPSTLEWKKGSWSTHVKLLIGVALFEVTVTKILQSPPLDGLFVEYQTSFSGTNSVVSSLQNKNWLLLLHGILATNRLDGIVGSSPSVGTCTGATWKFSSSSHLPGYQRFPHRLLDSLLSFRGSEASSNIILYANTTEVVCQGRHLARAQHTRVSGYATV